MITEPKFVQRLFCLKASQFSDSISIDSAGSSDPERDFSVQFFLPAFNLKFHRSVTLANDEVPVGCFGLALHGPERQMCRFIL